MAIAMLLGAPAAQLVACDEVERIAWRLWVERAIKLDEIRAKNSAAYIATAVGQLFR